jgi:hypothetical protein
LQTRHAIGKNYTYGIKEYMRMVTGLLSKIPKPQSNNDEVSHLLHLVLKSAPNWDAVLELFESPAVAQFFPNEDEKVEFVVKYCPITTRSKSKSPGTRLMTFHNIPANLRVRMHKHLLSILLEYAKSDNESNHEHRNVFLQLIKSGNLDQGQVVNVLLELARSKSIDCQNLLLEILKSENIQSQWFKIHLDKRKEICQSWVITRVVNKKSVDNSLVGVNKICATYEAVDAIMNCSSILSNKNLAQSVCTDVVKRILGNEDVISFLKAFSSVERCTGLVRKCYISYVKKLLKNASKTTIKKSIASIFLKQCSNSRYSHHRYSFFTGA